MQRESLAKNINVAKFILADELNHYLDIEDGLFDDRVRSARLSVGEGVEKVNVVELHRGLPVLHVAAHQAVFALLAVEKYVIFRVVVLARRI